jgi:hypothetical protein
MQASKKSNSPPSAPDFHDKDAMGIKREKPYAGAWIRGQPADIPAA